MDAEQQTTQTLRLAPGAVEWREVDGEVIALDLRGGRYLSTNPAGALLWPMLAEGATTGQLADRLREHYALPAEQAGRDAAAFVAWLRGEGLLAD